jgi:GDP-6-deoxy-D-talose 4-dehydrogenase
MEKVFDNKIFITGINGFTGKHLEKFLIQKGYAVFGTTLTQPERENHFYCDILKKELLFKILNKIKPSYIIHLAAISFVDSKNLQKMYEINILGTINLIEAIEKIDFLPKKILIVSSAAVYGNIEGELSEDDCPQPVNHYGNSKLVMENMVKQYFNKLNIVIVRPFNYTGLGQEPHFLIPKIVSHFKQNKKEIELGNIDVFREFNNVNFVIRCYFKLLFSEEVKSKILNVSTGNALNIKKILDVMKDISGYEINIRINPKFVRKNEIRLLKGSPKKLYSLMDGFINEYTIEETLLELYNV